MEKALANFRLIADQLPYNKPISDQFIISTLANLPNCRKDLAIYKRKHNATYMFTHADNTPLSFHKALRLQLGLKSTKTNHHWCCQAARLAIRPQITQFRKENSIAKHMHIDHVGDFIDLFDDWKMKNCIEKVKLRRGRFGIVMADQTQLKSWREHHKQHARLQPLSPASHRAITRARRQGRPRP
jgi:hypothetical protein